MILMLVEHGGAKGSGVSRPDQKFGPIGQPLSRKPVLKHNTHITSFGCCTEK